MKTLFSSILVAALLLCGCQSKKNNDKVMLLPTSSSIAALNDVNLSLIQKFKEYNNEMGYAARRIDREGMTSPSCNSVIASLQNLDGFIRLAGIIDNDGKRICNYPDVYYKKCGDSEVIANAAEMMKKIKMGESVMTGAYKNKFDEFVVNYMRPVKGEDDIVHGAVYIQIAITELLRHYVARQISGMPLNIWVMQTDGLILYDTDLAEVGINLLTSDYFKDYPSLIALGQKIVRYETGTGEYRYISKGNKLEMIKSTQWNSVSLGGHQLRIILNVEDRSFIQ